MDTEYIKTIIIKARRIFELHHEQISKTYFGNFPSGSCGSTASIIAEYLINKGIENIEYVCGVRNNDSHAWLEINGMIIDITGDQFVDGVDGVFISSNRDFHDQFTSQKRSLQPGISDFLCFEFNKFNALMEIPLTSKE